MKWKKYSVILISAIALIISEQIIYACGGAYYYYPHNAQFFGKIADKETALYVEEAGADFIGFVFAPSSRRIAPVQAKKIAKHLSTKIKKVGVFVDEPIQNIHHIAKLVGLDYIQLHGNEPISVANQINYPIIKAFSIHQVNPSTIPYYPCDYFLIDSPGVKYRGGSGNVFNWDVLEELEIDKNKLILAGGLSDANVKEAIKTVQPVGVDVSSGVESDGMKNHFKIQQFLNQAKYTGSERKVDIN